MYDTLINNLLTYFLLLSDKAVPREKKSVLKRLQVLHKPNCCNLILTQISKRGKNRGYVVILNANHL